MKIVQKTVRFRTDEMDKIDRFLDQNPVFDFSTLARAAIEKFMDQPELKLKRVEFGETLKRSLEEDREELDALAEDRRSNAPKRSGTYRR